MYESHRTCLSACVHTSDFLVYTKYTADSNIPVWPKPGNEPLVYVDRAILVTIHHQTTVLIFTAIRSLPQWHILLMFTCTTHSGRIAFAYYIQFFPKAQTLILKHPRKAIESPIIIHHAITYPPLVPLLGFHQLSGAKCLPRRAGLGLDDGWGRSCRPDALHSIINML